MALPIDIVLIRHGQSEGNLARRLSEKCDHRAIEKLSECHSKNFRLTDLGRQQASLAGTWFDFNFYHSRGFKHSGFDRCYTSEYFRAVETAGLLNIPNSEWLCNFYLCERDWGDLETCPEDKRWRKFGDALRLREKEPFFWKPPNGESFVSLCLRINRVLDTLRCECSGKRVILVCHGEVMWAFRVLLERMSQQNFKKLHLSKNSDNKIYNCQIFHYTRRNPKNDEITPHINWFRSVRPRCGKLWDTGWLTIKHPSYSSSDLLKMVEVVPRTIA